VLFDEVSEHLPDFQEMNPMFKTDHEGNKYYSYKCNEGITRNERLKAYNEGDATALGHYELNVDVNEFRALMMFLTFSLHHLLYNKQPFLSMEKGNECKIMILTSILESGLYSSAKDMVQNDWGYPFFNMPLYNEIYTMMNVYMRASYQQLCKKEGIWRELSQNKRFFKMVLFFFFFV
jgi:hypothetical protein